MSVPPAVAAALDRVRAHPGGSTALSLLSRVYMNVLCWPDEPKYRTLRRANATLAAQLFAVPGVDALLAALGFVGQADAFVLPLGVDLGDAEAAVATAITAAEEAAQPAATPPRASAPAAGGGLSAEERAAVLAASAKKLSDAAAERARVAAAARADQEERRAREAARVPKASRRVDAPGTGGGGITRFSDVGVDLNAKGGG